MKNNTTNDTGEISVNINRLLNTFQIGKIVQYISSIALAADCRGKGYATEAAHAALQVGFDTLELDEIVSFTSLLN